MYLLTSHKPKFEMLSNNVKDNFLGWSKNNKIMTQYFDDAQMNEYMRQHCSRLEFKAYSHLVTGAAKSDMFRIHYLIKRGGMWVDMDMPHMNLTNACTFPPFLR